MSSGRSDGSAARYRMKDLVERTGLRRETIHFYISEGLLPPAVKKQRNMAWYGAEHLERLEAIRTLQQKQFLPLKAIKAILNDEQGHAFTIGQRSLLERLKEMYRQREPEDPSALVDVAAVARRAGVPLSEVEDFAKRGAIALHGTRDGVQVAPEDAQLVESWGQLKALGCTPERGFSAQDFGLIENVLAILLDQEIKLFTERFSDMSEQEAWTVVERALPILNRVIGILHEKKIREFISGFGEDELRPAAKNEK